MSDAWLLLTWGESGFEMRANALESKMMPGQTRAEAMHIPQHSFAMPAPMCAVDWKNFLSRLANVAASARRLDGQTAQVLDQLAARLERHEVVITFGGLFSAGKSSVLNFAIGRPLLPVDDLPETGVACWLRSGLQDTVEVIDTRGQRRRIPCTPAALRTEVALFTPTGLANPIVSQVQQLEIRLADFPAPTPVCWIDAPGLNSGAESERAEQAADMADVLVWVLKSEQLLSETDVAAVTRHVQRHGPGSVVLLINGFLPQDTPAAWEKFQAQRLPAYHQRIRDRLALMGFPDGYMLPVVTLSAQAAAQAPMQYGGPDFHRLMAGLDAADTPLVRRGRLGRAAVDLRQLAARIEPQFEQASATLARERRACEAQRQEAAQQRKHFTEAVERAVDTFLEEWARRTCECGMNVAGTISADALVRDGTYGQQLTAALQAAAREVCDALVRRVETDARSWQHVPLRVAEAQRLRSLLTPPAAEVVVPDNPIKGSTVAKSTAVGVGVSVLPVIGWIAGALGGAVVGMVKAVKEAEEKDAEETRANIQRAVEHAVTALRGKRQDVLEFLLRHCTMQDVERLHARPDDTPVHRWESLLREIRHLADHAGELVHGSAWDWAQSASASTGKGGKTARGNMLHTDGAVRGDGQRETPRAFCRKCGEQLVAGAKFCNQCGEKVL